MNRKQTHLLYAKGKDAWNAWAGKMLAKRKEMEAAKTWTADEETWLVAASIEFSTSSAPHKFEAAVDCSGWTFPGNASFAGATFTGAAVFEGATFSGNAEFSRTNFAGDALFNNAIFTGEAGFYKAIFTNGAWFHWARFRSDAWFEGAKFKGRAVFEGANFEGRAAFDEAIFAGYALFSNATFSGTAAFAEAEFASGAKFAQVTFEGFTTYESAIFKRGADFSAIRSERTFTLAGTTIHGVPDFIQAHFAEAPRLDISHFRRGLGQPGSFRVRMKARVKRLFQGEESAAAKWRALKRLATQGHDHDREQDFFAREIKSARFVTDFPLTWRLWSGAAWAGVARWWFGWLYQLFSGFGRSLVRPLGFWLLAIALGTLYFLGQCPDIASRRPGGVVAYLVTSADAWSGSQRCVAGDILRDGRVVVSGLAEPVRAQTSAATEAMHLALRNAFIFLDGGADAAHRTFGCLYGVERYGDNPVAIVPSNVSFASALQKAFSAVLIFLFGLAVRNMLRMK